MSDLEHWNLYDDLTIHQAAALAAGTDPANYPDESPNLPPDQRFGPPAYYVINEKLRTAFHETLSRTSHAIGFFIGAAPAWHADPEELHRVLKYVTHEPPDFIVSKSLAKYLDRLKSDPNLKSRRWLGAMQMWARREEYQLVFEVGQQRFSRNELDRFFRANGGGVVLKYQFVPEPAAAPPVEAVPAEKPLDERAETTYLNIIGGMLALMLGKSPAGVPQSVYRSQAAIIDALLAHHENTHGITKRTLEEKFAAAKRSLNGT